MQRCVAREIIDRRDEVASVKNRFGDYYSIKENLTFYRRKLYKRVEKELTSFKYGWIENSAVYVKKERHPSCRPIKITTEEKLEELLERQNCESQAAGQPCSPHQTNKLPIASSTPVINKNRLAV